MSVRPLRKKQLGPFCSWCDRRATLVGYGFSKFACPDHRPDLEAWDKSASAPDYSDAAFYGGY